MNSRRTIENARLLRANQTPSEELLWKILRDRRLENYKFRRQHPIEPYVADFACVAAQLIVELDGPIHEQTVERDAVRSEFLQSLGWQILRLPNADLKRDPDEVVSKLLKCLAPEPSA